jgi:glycosyltransferase involved in cell wall biosynthesis
VQATRRRHGLETPYLLFAGGFDPRKNVPGALRAFAAALPRLSPEVVLAVSGGPGGAEREARALVEALGIAARVRFLGFLSDADFAALMSGCEAFLFVSLFEGFGLPALEAMACGAAVIASSTTSLPEICGDAALLVAPEDPSAIAAAMVRLSDEPRRDDLRRRALARARSYSWRRAAAEMLDLYGEAAARAGAPSAATAAPPRAEVASTAPR